MAGKYRTFGAMFDRIFRNNLNANFDDIDTDIKAQKTRVDNLIVGTPQPSEVVDARGGKPVLKDRLDAVDASLTETVTSFLNYPKIIPELDDTARFQRAINGSTNKKLVLTPINLNVSNTINLISDIYVVGYGASITQTSTNTAIFSGVSIKNITFEGIKFYGVGTDYTKASGSLARAIYITGAIIDYSQNINIIKCEFYNFSFTPISFRYVKGFTIFNNKIVGTAASKGNMVANDNYQYGVWLDQYCNDGLIEFNDVSQTAQGLFQGYNMYNIKYYKNHIHDIAGQHGFYLSHGNKLTVQDNTIENCALNGIKLQQATTSNEISTQVSITLNKISNCGGHGISTQNVDPSKVLNIFDSIIAFNQIKDCASDGINVQDLFNSFVQFNEVINSTSFIADTTKSRYGIYVAYCQNVDVFLNQAENINQIGLFIHQSNTSINAKRNRITNAGQAQISSYNYGMYVFSGDDITAEDNKVEDKTGKSLYSFVMNTATNVRIKNNRFMDKDVRFLTATAPSEWDNNTVGTGNIVGYPSAIIKGRKANIYHGTVANAPTVSTGYVSGDRYDYTNPSAGGYMGKILIGTTWKDYGSITP